MSRSRAWISGLLLSCAALCGGTAQAYSEMVVFGDSLSDNGNVYQVLQGALPASPYWNGRYSNGPVAAEIMANQLGLSLVDLAYGGATTGTGSLFYGVQDTLATTGMANQVSGYISSQSGSVRSDALYMLWGGGNDFLSVMSVGSPSLFLQVGQMAVANLGNEVRQLYQAGARDFFVPLLPDLAYTYYGTSGYYAPGSLSLISQLFNTGLQSELSTLASTYSDARITVFDTATFLSGVRADLQAQGGNVTDPCWLGNYLGGGTSTPVCANPDRYALFDAVHPTAYVHDRLGQAFAATVLAVEPVAQVPEPSTVSLAVFGGLLLLWVVRRRAPG